MNDNMTPGRKVAVIWSTLVLALFVIAAVAPVAGASTSPRSLTPSRMQVLADDAGVVRGLLDIENSLTYDAVARDPLRQAIASQIRGQNNEVVKLCNAIIRDVAAQKLQEARRAEERVKALRREGEFSRDMREMRQLMANRGSLSNVAASVTSAADSSIASVARTVDT